MRAAAECAFGEHVDVDGLVSQDGDVLVRVTWDQRHPVPARVLELVGPDAGPSLWPAPCLVSPLVLYDRQEYDLNWWSLSNVLIASPAGQGAEIPLTVDCDQGQSGASAADRAGFQQLVAEVGLGHAGIVLGLEVSRLARSSTDWHQLLELCALSQTLILDEDGLYYPGHYNDGLLLGLKGTLSEAELHVLHARLIGGQRSKARRGELKQILPIGFAYDPLDRVVLDPDQQVQQAVRLVFQTYRRTGSACSTVKHFSEQDLLFPHRVRSGPAKDELRWGSLSHDLVRRILHNPRYAGAFSYGRTTVHRRGDGRVSIERLPRDQWQVLIQDAHIGYITWVEYERNLVQLRQTAQSYGAERRASPPREGPALLQGLVVCGRCGDRMTVRYDVHKQREVTTYVCMRARIHHAQPVCQRVHGQALDAAVSELLMDSITSMNLESP
jgi:DNA invertase Pin-like site-specific DNA recombinase